MKKSRQRNVERRALSRARSEASNTVHEGNGRSAYRVEGGQIVRWFHTGVMNKVRRDMARRMAAGLIPQFDLPGLPAAAAWPVRGQLLPFPPQREN